MVGLRDATRFPSSSWMFMAHPYRWALACLVVWAAVISGESHRYARRGRRHCGVVRDRCKRENARLDQGFMARAYDPHRAYK